MGNGQAGLEALEIAMAGAWSNKNVFITGCTGFVGYWLTEHLLSRGAAVTGLVHQADPRSHYCRFTLQERITAVSGTLDDLPLLEQTLASRAIDTVFHLAAQSQVAAGSASPLPTFETNIRGTWNMLEACRKNSGTVNAVVIASSGLAYGAQAQPPYTEEAPLQGTHPYGASKACAEMLAAAYHAAYGLPVCATRCSSIFGPGDTDIRRLIPGTIMAALKKQPVVIRSDGTPRRDHLYVKDAAAAFCLLAENIQPLKLAGEAFNFSAGAPVSVLELTNMILTAMGAADLSVTVANTEQHEAQDRFLSIDKAKAVLGWMPRHAMPDALKETIADYRTLEAS
ncbi:NAD-dependent epimerase/dehydratase family protein [Thermodesulfobacteriota bacterium]